MPFALQSKSPGDLESNCDIKEELISHGLSRNFGASSDTTLVHRMILNSQIFRGVVVHERFSPKSHKFSYPMSFFGFDLAELKQINAQASIFGYNEAKPLRLNDSDYLHGSSEPIIEQLDRLLPVKELGQSTILVSSPKYFGYAFNPVNFHLRMEGERLLCAVAEVNNTFGDRHVYPLKELEQINNKTWIARCMKDFHVSPFNDMSGEYRFTFNIDENKIFLGIDLYQNDTCIMKTWIQGQGQSVTNRSIFRYALLHPFDTALNSMPRIIWQAAVLYYKKKMEVFKRPSPVSNNTLVDRDEGRDDSPVI